MKANRRGVMDQFGLYVYGGRKDRIHPWYAMSVPSRMRLAKLMDSKRMHLEMSSFNDPSDRIVLFEWR